MKKLLIQLVIAIALTSSPSRSNAQAEVIAVITEGAKITKQVYAGISWIYNHQEQIKMVFRGFRYNHRWWACIYQDGFVTYNNFRSYRNSMDAYNYFVLGNGDCDAIYYNRQRASSPICYQTPFQARSYTEQHGVIVDIQYQDDNGNYRSILAY